MTSTPEWAAAPGGAAPGDFTLHVNDEDRRVRCARDTPLLYVLRNDLGLKGPRFGCGLGQCGACMVLLDGHATPSCDYPVWAAEKHTIVTVEGLTDDGAPGPMQRAFLAEQAAQCGFCMSGILVAATALLRENPDPDEDDVRAALDRNLCRCGSHTRVIRAVRRAAVSGEVVR
jgi:nicotinate dehydrogenase subunit A